MHRRQALKLFAGLALCPLCAPQGFAADAHHWSYEGAEGPAKWGDLDAASRVCSVGIQQSPVDIGDSSVLGFGNTNYRLLQFHFHRPSEHLIGGKSFPMEAHFVHANTKG